MKDFEPRFFRHGVSGNRERIDILTQPDAIDDRHLVEGPSLAVDNPVILEDGLHGAAACR